MIQSFLQHDKFREHVRMNSGKFANANSFGTTVFDKVIKVKKIYQFLDLILDIRITLVFFLMRIFKLLI